MTDEARHYIRLGREFAQHGVVHRGNEEYVNKDDPAITTNTVEGFFSVFKRRAALEGDDFERTIRTLAGVKGKRLTYKPGVDLTTGA